MSLPLLGPSDAVAHTRYSELLKSSVLCARQACNAVYNVSMETSKSCQGIKMPWVAMFRTAKQSRFEFYNKSNAENNWILSNNTASTTDTNNI